MTTGQSPAFSAERELLDYLLAEEALVLGDTSIRPRDPGRRVPLSFAQERLWTLQRLAPESPVYHIFQSVRFPGELHTGHLRDALRAVLNRHEILRAAIVEEDGVPHLRFAAEVELPFVFEDLRTLDAALREETVNHRAQAVSRQAFDFTTPPFIRVSVLRTADDEHMVLLCMHHIVADGWSLGILLEETAANYRALMAGLQSPFLPLPVQYADFAVWQRDHEPEMARQLSYWSRQLDGLPTLELPLDFTRPQVQSFDGSTVPVAIRGALLRDLRKVADGSGVSLFMVLLAAFQTLLARYSGQQLIPVGSPVANRNREETESLIGFFVNMLVMRGDLTGNPSFRELLARTRDAAIDAYANQDVPFPAVVQALHAPREPGRNPLFQVVLALQNAPAAGESLAGMSLLPEPENVTSKFDLSLLLEEQSDGIAGGLEYGTKLFRRSTVVRIARQYVNLLESIVAYPDAPVEDLRIDTDWPANWNDTRRPFPRAGLAELFEEAVSAHGSRLAAAFGDLRLTYRELNERANRLAWYLRRHGVTAESLVGMSVDEGLDAVVTMLAVIKAGGAYAPLRPGDPRRKELAHRMTQTRGMRCLVVSDAAPSLDGIRTISLKLDATSIAAESGENPPIVSGAAHLAYVIHTSGSTGLPKGIAIPQAGVVRLVRNTDYLQVSPGMRIGQISTYAFDAITFEVWGALLNGGCLIDVPRAVKLDPGRLATHIREQGIEAMFLTTALFNQVISEKPAAFAGMKTLMVGGEALVPQRVNEALEKGPPERLLNAYGPTECTTFALWHEIRPGDVGAAVPIGKPLANTTAYLVGAELTERPVGVLGEIWLGGPGLARCYLGDARMTAERYVPDPFSKEPGNRLYRTGDLGRRREDGAIDFAGRRDTQVKLRGFRIEPGEIEVALKTHPGVRDAAVQLRDGRLMAWAAVGDGISPRDLRWHLEGKLPEYMVPASIAVLPSLPLNNNGKIDRQALPDVEPEDAEGGQIMQPLTQAEAAVSDVWRSVLRRTAGLATDANYFAAGGDSITAIQIVNRLQFQGWQASIMDLLQYPTIVGFAATLRRGTIVTAAAEKPQPATGDVPLGPAQRWFFSTHKGPVHHFNQSVMLASSEPLDSHALGRALDFIVRQHEMLRARFQAGGVQWIDHKSQTAAFETVDLKEASDAENIRIHAERIQAGLDLQRGPVFRAALLRLATGDRLLLVAHHLVVDGVSWRILLEDLERAYEQALRGEEMAAASGSMSYPEWAQAIERYSRTPALIAEAAFWSRLEAGVLRAPQPGRYGSMESVSISFDPGETEALLTEPARVFGAATQDLLLTALGNALNTATWIALEGHGREPLGLSEIADTSQTVGWFTSVWPFRLEVTAASPADQIKEMKEKLRAVPHKGAGYGILRYITPPDLRPDIQWPEPRVSFNYLGQFDDGGAQGGGRLRFATESTGDAIDPRIEAPHDLDVVAITAGGRLTTTFHFQPAAWPGDAIPDLTTEFRRQAVLLANSCRATLAQEKTPSDFTVPCLSLAEYRDLLASNRWHPGLIEDVYPVSPLQAGLLFETLSQTDRQAYFVQVSYTLRGRLDLTKFEQSWNRLARRHPVLRTAFVHEGVDEPLQVVFRERPIPFATIGVSAGIGTEIRSLEAQDRARGFRLDREPLMRVTVAAVEPDLHQVIWSYHHLLLDGWSLGVLHAELLSIYQASLTHREPGLSTAAPYGSYIRWVRRQDRATARRFWADYLAGHEGTQGPPRDLAGGTSRQEEFEFTLDAPTSAAARNIAASLGVTLNSVLQAVWGLMLGRYNATQDCVFGTIVSGRPAQLPGVEGMIGLFINAVPVRVRPEHGKPFSDIVRELQRDAFAREPHQYLPLPEMQQSSHFPAFDHLLTFENYPLDSGAEQATETAGGLRIEGTPRAHDRTHYAFGLTIFPADRIHFKIGYDGAFYSPELLRYIAGHWNEAIRRIGPNPDILVEDCDFVSEAERDLLIKQFQPESTGEQTLTIVDRFREQAAKVPDAVAVRCLARAATYAELDAASDRVASGLHARGFGSPARIALLLDRSDRLVACILGILKAGCAFVPLEPGMPRDRIRFILEDCSAAALIVQESYRSIAGQGTTRIDPAEFDSQPPLAPSPPVAGDLAYLIYTSGSTGRPKGCQITHANLAHYLGWASDYYFGANAGGSFPLFTPLAFDLTITSLFLPLLRGQTVHVYPGDAGPEEALADILRPGSGVDAVKLTPAHMALVQYLETGPTDVRVMIAGGEALPLDRVRYCQSLNSELVVYNEYGPTETTVGCIVRKIEANDRRVLIGRPIANTTVYIVDDLLRPCPIGVSGEILIGGRGVSRGYVNREDLNRLKFIPDPFREGHTVYRTGDLGRWLADGEIEYLGRTDDQLKVRGYRIEPGEIEQCLLGDPGVKAAAVIADASRSELLACYVGETPPIELRTRLGLFLPEYMVPSAFIRVEEIPLTANGKTDKAALLRQREAAVVDCESAPEPESLDETESAIAEIWKEVLGIEMIRPDTNFFDAGGHSLRAMQVASRIRQALGVRIPLREFLRNSTLAELAARVRIAQRGQFEAIPVAAPQPDYPLSYAQQRLWLVTQWNGAGVAYNMPRAMRLEGDLVLSALQRAFEAVIQRHESLRTAFFEAAGEPRQRVLPRVDFALELTDLSADPDAENLARERTTQDALRPFDPGHPPLFRARLIRLRASTHVLSMAMHHIVGDGWSMTVFYNEVIAAYDAFAGNLPNPLSPPPLQYKDFAVWQLRQPMREPERYWLDRLSGVPGGIRLPWDFPPSGERDFQGATHSSQLTPEVTARLEAIARQHGATLSNVFLTLLYAWLHAWTRQDDLCIGVSVAGRDHPDTENMIGFFVNMLPIRVHLAKDQEFDHLLGEVRQASEEAFERQHYPFDRLVQILNPERSYNRQPLVNVVYAFQNFADVRIASMQDRPGHAVPAVRIGDFDLDFATSKFDLTFFVSKENNGLNLSIEYDTGLFRGATIHKCAANIRRFAESIAGGVN